MVMPFHPKQGWWQPALIATMVACAAASQGRIRAQAAAVVFQSQPVDTNTFTVLARPLAESRWTLLVLEQLKPQPACWSKRPDGLVDPALNGFDFKDICSRYLDSNAYSLRLGDEDLASRYRLKVVPNRRELQLRAMGPNQSETLLVARAPRPAAFDKDGFVELTLEPAWALERRSYQGKPLGHLYFAHDETLPTLLARARGGSSGFVQASDGFLPSLTPTAKTPGVRRSGPIGLEVIPYRR